MNALGNVSLVGLMRRARWTQVGTRHCHRPAVPVGAICLACAVTFGSEWALASEQSVDTRRSQHLEEVVVTAQKRTERLQDVPIPVTAIRADDLLSSNNLKLQDYYTKIPGLSVTPSVRGAAGLTIRGVTTGGATNPTVGIVVDDVPYGSSTGAGGGDQAPDLDPSELSRIEVLRGPQGTLYGASSIGGLLKFVTVDPSTDELAGRFNVSGSNVAHSDEFGYNMRTAVNIPLSDTLAVRASGFTRRDPGYIDDPGRGVEDINSVDVQGGRLSALWQPSENVSLKLGALYQQSEADGSPNVYDLPGLGDLQQSALPGTGEVDRETQVYSAILTAQIGSSELTSVTGYSINKLTDTFDFTFAFGGLSAAQFGEAGTPLVEHFKTTKFTQELRLSTPLSDRVDWLVGAFYTDEDSRFVNDFLVTDVTTGLDGPIVGSWLHTINPNTFSEYAVFTDLTFKITDAFDIQVGGRQSRNRQTNEDTKSGPLVPLFLGVPSPSASPRVTSKDDSFTYLITPRLRVSPDLMVYARLASGYRVGGPNLNLAAGVPKSFDPDTTRSYEIGAKGSLWDQALSYDVSVYYVDWEDIQLELLDPATTAVFVGNGSQATSQGVELALESRPLDGLAIAATMAWNEAELAEAFPAGSTAYGVDGDRLPYSSRLSGSLSVDEEFPLTNDLTGFIGGSLSYIGDRKGVFTNSPARQSLPSYARTDLRAGVMYDTWTVNLFCTNLTDRRGVLTGGVGTNPPFALNYIQPRTVGLSLSRTF